jgi:hypothetical protein
MKYWKLFIVLAILAVLFYYLLATQLYRKGIYTLRMYRDHNLENVRQYTINMPGSIPVQGLPVVKVWRDIKLP